MEEREISRGSQSVESFLLLGGARTWHTHVTAGEKARNTDCACESIGSPRQKYRRGKAPL
jgi:hypothetical protein